MPGIINLFDNETPPKLVMTVVFWRCRKSPTRRSGRRFWTRRERSWSPNRQETMDWPLRPAKSAWELTATRSPTSGADSPTTDALTEFSASKMVRRLRNGNSTERKKEDNLNIFVTIFHNRLLGANAIISIATFPIFLIQECRIDVNERLVDYFRDML